jgi:DNA modification methylase
MKYPDDFVNKILCGDSEKLLKLIPDESIDLVITDPPYGIDYEGGHFHSGDVNIKRKREKLENDKSNHTRRLSKSNEGYT